MSRTLPSGLADALAATQLFPVFLVEIDWPDGNIYFWNGYHSFSWDSKTWVGTGNLGNISEIKETNDMTASGVSLSLSGIPSSIVTSALRNDAQGRPVKIYFGVLGGAGFTIDPYLQFSGLIDTVTIADDGKTATVTVACETEMVDNRTAARRYTDQDQQLDYPGDTGLRFVAGLANATFTWGSSTITSVAVPPASIPPPKLIGNA